MVQLDIVIAVMGPTGTGKSTFIDTATRQDGTTIGHKLGSYTSEVRAVRYTHPTSGKSYVLVDTPGFDDTQVSDTEVLNMIAKWLEETYKNSVRVAGLLYLHRISDNRMAGTPLKNLDMFTKLCGNNALSHVVLTTTMWGRLKGDIGEKRDRELSERYWKPMLDIGSKSKRFNDTWESAWEIILGAVEGDPKDPQALLLQEELVDFHRRLRETEAGKTLYTSLQKLLVDQKSSIRALRNQAKSEEDPNMVKELDAQYNDLEKSLQDTFNQVERLKIPIGRRIRLFFTFKKPQTRVVDIPSR